MDSGMSRRALAAAVPWWVCATRRASAGSPLRIGLTPVFLDNDAALIARLRAAFADALGAPVDLLQRRTYAEVTGLLLEGGVDAAWLCGYPYLQHAGALALLGVPVWRGRPLYRSYLIVSAADRAGRLTDLAGGVHAFSDPDSNSGWLVTASDLARIGLSPERFFGRTFFTWGHRNVVRAVGSGLARSGSVDGYVWEALAVAEPTLAERTRVIAQSEWLGFPPFVARADRVGSEPVEAFRQALLSLPQSPSGRAALALLQLDGVAPGEPALFDGIAVRIRDLEGR
jgi:phosphonate transport system substrate-binding protein